MKPIEKQGKRAVIIEPNKKNLDFKKIKTAGIDAVIYKVPCSLIWNRKNILNSCRKAKDAGLLVGIGCELDIGRSVNLQGLYFSNIVYKVNPDIYPVVEFIKNNNSSKKNFSDKGLKFLKLIKENINMDCIVKANIKFANENLDIRFRNKMFWVVDNGKDKPSNSTVWKDWTCFNYSNNFIIKGIESSFEISEIKEKVIRNLSCNCGCEGCGGHILEDKASSHISYRGLIENKKLKELTIKQNKGCNSIDGYIKGEIVEKLQLQLNKQFKAEISVDGCFTEETLDKCILIMKNAYGPITKIIQTRLVSNGFSIGKAGLDGIYGNCTIEAVKKFQKVHGLKVTGVINKTTWKELFKKR